MSDNNINELDVNDVGLKQIFGDRFQDATAQSPAQERKERVTANTYTGRNVEQKPAAKPVERDEDFRDAKWEPVKAAPNWMDKLRACAFGVLTFGGLSLLLFCWEQAGLMDASVAVPSMCVCTGMVGLTIGKNTRGDR